MDYPGKVIRKTPVTPTQTSASGVWTVDDALQAVKTNTWPIAGVPNPISRSLRFNRDDSTYLSRTPGSNGNRKTWTFSFWWKPCDIGASSPKIIQAGTSGHVYCNFQSDGTIYFDLNTTGGGARQTTQVFRDFSAWYHIVFAVDTTQATANDRVKIYVNGAQVTNFATLTNPNQNVDTTWNSTVEHNIGRRIDSPTNSYPNMYLTEVYNIDGQQLTPSDFGLTDPQTGQWVPKKYTGTYGTNGFYLNFSDNSSTSALGNDYSGNSNNWTTNNFSVTAGAGNDSLTDVPTPWIAYNTTGDVGGVFRGNYCTANPLDIYPKSGTWTVSNGNLDLSLSGAVWDAIRGTTGVTSGKWYWEITATGINNTNSYAMVGIQKGAGGNWQDPFAYVYYSLNGQKYNNGSGAAYGNSWTTNDVIGVAFDADAGEIKFYKNNTVQNSGTAAFTGLTSGPYTPVIMLNGTGSAATVTCNFGQRPFAYTPPAGFLSLCTTNLPTPTIGATSTTQAGKYFNPVLYTGTGSSLGVTGVGFQPDLVWIKSRSAITDHSWYDAVRGVQKQLECNNTDAETTETTGLTAFGTDGFTVGALAQLNTNTATYVAWNWNGGGSNATNTSGSITSTVRANTTAGFSIVTYTGTGANATVGHGCKVNNVATAPSFIICKERNTAGYDWRCYHASLGATKYIDLNSNAAAATASTIWQDTAPTTTVFSVGTNGSVNVNTGAFVAYCFAAVASYSSFGSYVGNGSSDGPFIYTGFRPKWIMVKRSDVGEGWYILDTSLNTYNLAVNYLDARATGAESVANFFDILSNGFKIRATGGYENANGGTYIYAAFAEFPFKFSNAR